MNYFYDPQQWQLQTPNPDARVQKLEDRAMKLELELSAAQARIEELENTVQEILLRLEPDEPPAAPALARACMDCGEVECICELPVWDYEVCDSNTGARHCYGNGVWGSEFAGWTRGQAQQFKNEMDATEPAEDLGRVRGPVKPIWLKQYRAKQAKHAGK